MVVNIRTDKTSVSADIGDIKAGDRVKYAPLEGGWWPIIWIAPDGKETAGFASDLYFEPTPRQSESPPPVDPEPIPPPPPEEWPDPVPTPLPDPQFLSHEFCLERGEYHRREAAAWFDLAAKIPPVAA